ncbi:MAG: BatA and WFA domain-containing protein [Deltaproteobacteria bacterium]|nr:BatA and WFA domain-containing protein [Deltaproteobacteria bacterium]
MSAGFPFALAALVLAVPLVAAYLHRRRRVEKRVPSLLLLRVIAGTSRPTRRAWSRPRHLVSLVLVLLALVGLVLALVDLHDEHDRPRDFVVVFDTSASMGASDGSTRLQHGIEAVDTALGALRPGDRVALVTTGAQTLVRVGLTEDHGRVREVLGTLTPEGGSQGAAAALRIADAICRAGEDGSIVLVSDLVGVDIPATSCPVEHIAVGRDGPNAGIVALSVREADALGLSEIHVGLTSTMGRVQEVELTLDVDGAVVDVLSLDLPANGEIEKLHRVPLPPGERVGARITHLREDALVEDDAASVARQAGGRVANLVVLEADYQAGPLPFAPKLVAFGTTPTRLGALASGKVESPEILRWSYDHPLFRFVDLQNLDITEALVLVPTEEQTSLLDIEAGSLAVTGRFDGRDMVYLAFSPVASDLVLRVAFVNFMANLVEWAAPPPPERDDARQGVLSLTESHLAPPPKHGDAAPRFAAGTLAGAPLWTWLAIAALLALVVEWLLPALVAAVVRLRARASSRRRA